MFAEWKRVKTTYNNNKTLYIEALNEHYHSHRAAKKQSMFLSKMGLKKIGSKEINILEMGFGTGLNVLVSIEEFLKIKDKKINYFSFRKISY